MTDCPRCPIHCDISESVDNQMINQQIDMLNTKINYIESSVSSEIIMISKSSKCCCEQFQEQLDEIKKENAEIKDFLLSESQKKIIKRKLQEYYKIYLTSKYQEEFEKYYNEISQRKRKKYVIKYEQFFKMLPQDFALKFVETDFFDFEDLINNSSYWESSNAIHKLSESKKHAQEILKNEGEVILKLLELVYSNLITIEKQKEFFNNEKNIIKKGLIYQRAIN
jgi:hypothetical protein